MAHLATWFFQPLLPCGTACWHFSNLHIYLGRGRYIKHQRPGIRYHMTTIGVVQSLNAGYWKMIEEAGCRYISHDFIILDMRPGLLDLSETVGKVPILTPQFVGYITGDYQLS
ncbi:hypothetical protein L211DRAFT_724329 [Terfezia boudieri ATCC MYA-4762]|uniref:Uncharacterized protein n=1 Tax=Terfezia boudieri ATCC MYA-4762 TaxID=1051890 RepID=A0A3N4L7G6_9PEZI|nr:hypothetical protein L211DRAFT_724329 [Terfezia boudieri ATCC MYA-4762]